MNESTRNVNLNLSVGTNKDTLQIIEVIALSGAIFTGFLLLMLAVFMLV